MGHPLIQNGSFFYEYGSLNIENGRNSIFEKKQTPFFKKTNSQFWRNKPHLWKKQTVTIPKNKLPVSRNKVPFLEDTLSITKSPICDKWMSLWGFRKKAELASKQLTQQTLLGLSSSGVYVQILGATFRLPVNIELVTTH